MSIWSRFKDTIPKLRRLKKPTGRLFWAWVAYQAIKGTLTMSLIWVPLLLAWLHTSGHFHF